MTRWVQRYDRLGDIDQQRVLLERALAINEREYGRALGVCTGRPAVLDVIRPTELTIPICSGVFWLGPCLVGGPDHHTVATTLVNLGSVYGRSVGPKLA